jgi:GNAT superfamily N-acetyltransferase
VLTPLPTPPAPPAGLEVRRVTDAAGLRTWYDTAAAGFGMTPGGLDAMAADPACVRDADIAFLVGSCEGRPVAVATVCCVDGIAAVAGVATVPAYRRRGFGAALTWAALAEGAARGCTAAALNAGDLSYPLYVGMGFVPACKHRTYAVPDARQRGAS